MFNPIEMKKIFLYFLTLIFCSVTNKIFAQYGTVPATSQIVFITGISKNGTDFIIDADFVQMLTGRAAVTAAKKKGEAEYDINKKKDTVWYVPNDYFILNENNKVRKLTITPATQIFLIKEGTAKLNKSTALQLKRAYEGKLYQLSIVNDRVIKIKEIYTP